MVREEGDESRMVREEGDESRVVREGDESRVVREEGDEGRGRGPTAEPYLHRCQKFVFQCKGIGVAKSPQNLPCCLVSTTLYEGLFKNKNP